MEEIHRIFVGGLFDSITKDELSDRFQSFGSVTDTTIIQKKDGEGNVSKTFGYVNLMTTTQKLNKCFALFGGTKWKGHQLKVQLAKENFMTRLEKEWNEPPVEKKKKKHCTPQKTYTEILEITAAMKKSVPGTPVEGERNWVIGKYGRPLPIVYIPRVDRRKVIRIDPSKFCHCLKRIANVDDDDGLHVDTLTWSYDNDEKDFNCKKRKRKKKVHSECKEDTNRTVVDTNEEVIRFVGCAEEITGINGDLSTPQKLKKKKRKAEVKENVPASCSSEDNEPGNFICDSVDQKKRKHKDKKLEVIQQNDEGNDHINIELPVSAVEKETSKGSSEKRDKTIQNRETVDGIGYTEEITDKHDNLDIPQKYKKGKRKADIKENIPNSCSSENNNLAEDIYDDGLNTELSESAAEKENSKCTSEEYESVQDCIPILGLYEDIKEDPMNIIIDSNEKTLSTGIVKQLLSSAKKSQSNYFNCNKSYIEIRDNSEVDSTHKDNTSDEDEIDNTENLFDFEFKDIGGKNEFFLKKLMENVEIRENFNEITNDSNDESDSSSDSSNKYCLNKEVKNEHPFDSECQATMVPNENIKIKKDEGNTEFSVENIKQLDTNKKINKLNATSKQEKHAISEEQRKKSLEVRNSQILQHKGVVNKALKAVDKSNIGNVNRIVFDESESEEESATTDKEAEQHTSNVEETVKIAKHLWDDSDEEVVLPGDKSAAKNTLLFGDDEENDDEEIKVKPQFQGKGGEKLFKMQQRFGGDERFRLDERFAEDDVNRDKESNTEDADDITDTNADLQKEKEMNISVLGQVLGRPVELGKKASDYMHQRYDPENIDHKKFEVKVKTPDINTKYEELEIPKIKKDKPIQKLPEVSKETFYSVNESIKDLFGKGDSSGFSFLGNQDQSDNTIDEVDIETNSENIIEEIVEHDSQVVTEQTMEMEIDPEEETEETMKADADVSSMKEPSWKKGLEKMYQADQALRDSKIFNDVNESVTAKTKKCTYLYFADDDERLETGKRFIRTENIEEITNQWRAIRRNLTEDYKKKHKDAIRRIRKMKDRRFNRR